MVRLDEEGVKTMDGDMSGVIKVQGLCAAGFRVEPLEQVLAVAKYINLTTYPKPCPFVGEHVEGAIIGVRL